LIFETPPDISLPMANPAPVGADETTRRIQMLELGDLYAIPYSSHPLFIEMASPPVLILQSSIHTFVQESGTIPSVFGESPGARMVKFLIVRLLKTHPMTKKEYQDRQVVLLMGKLHTIAGN
jgi:hypothetical protein